MRSHLAVTAAAVALLGAGAPSSSAQAPPCELSFDDVAFDNTTSINPVQGVFTDFQPSNSLDIRSVVLRHYKQTHDGSWATSATIEVGKFRPDKIPAGSNAVSWVVQWTAADEKTYFVRGIVDAVNVVFGGITLEWGEVIPGVTVTVGNVARHSTTRYEYRGSMGGSWGDTQLTLPLPTELGATGAVFRDVYAFTEENRHVVPNAVTTPVRGVGSMSDRAPNGTATAGPWTAALCPDPAP